MVNADHIVRKSINNLLNTRALSPILFLPVVTTGDYIDYKHAIIIKRLIMIMIMIN